MPITYPPIRPPSRLGALVELRTPLDLLVSAGRWLSLPRRPVETPRTVLMLPGFGATERSMAVIGRHLRRLGHRVHDWGLGRNDGDVPGLLEKLEGRIGGLVTQAAEPIVAVGWSLGGYLAREAARDRPEWFRKVITLGSPVVGGPKFTAAAAWYRERGFDVDRIERIVAERYDTPLRVPVVAIYSKRDGVVAWPACIDRWSPRVQHIEVSETHLGLGLSPRSIAVVAQETGSA
jgi:pimeloyl-ACP methyl ester carboxylesterase